MVINPREVLGVSPNATLDECRRAYKRLARKHHPDNGGDEDKFNRIFQAYKAIESGEEVNVVLGRGNKAKVLTHVSLFKFMERQV